jgi:hypothetical protein
MVGDDVQRSGEHVTALLGVLFRGGRLALALVLGAAVRADRAVVETVESDQSVAEALATIGNCSTVLRSVRTSQT